MTRRVVTLGALSSLLFATACALFLPDRIHYEHAFDPEKPAVSTRACIDEMAPDERMLGISLSGGGSRAAVFAMAGLEALWEHGLLDQVTHISSVSGGSMASSYYLARQPTCDFDELQDADRLEICWSDFFAEFRKTMRRNYIRRLELRQLWPNRWFSSTRRTTSMQEELDRRFLDKREFGDIEAGPASADGPATPVLLINATSYDSGRRFVFANACIPEDQPDASDVLQKGPDRSRGSQYEARRWLAQEQLRASSFSYPGGCNRAVPGDFPVSLAVATSAAFPPIMGPISIQAPAPEKTCDGTTPNWWHLGDGGIIENTGMDTLEEVLLWDRAAGGDLDRAFLFSVDAGKKTTVARRMMNRNPKMWTSSAGIAMVVDAPRTAARGYHDAFWDRERMPRHLARDGIGFGRGGVEYTQTELPRWPRSCPQYRKEPWTGPKSEDFDEIRTDLKISQCHADMLNEAAHRLVHEEMKGETGRRLRELGFTFREAYDPED